MGIVVCMLLNGLLVGATPPSKNILLGKFAPEKEANFVKISDRCTDKQNIYLQKEAYEAYLRMYDDARKEGINLVIVSATRNYDSQLRIWNRKWQKASGNDSVRVCEIMRYSSMPGTSRHHWGTDIDLVSVETGFWETGEGKKVYRWLCENAVKYGFYQPYTADAGRTGYAEERWHWSYYPIADGYLQAYIGLIREPDINGFEGCEMVGRLNIIKSHVMGVASVPKFAGYK